MLVVFEQYQGSGMKVSQKAVDGGASKSSETGENEWGKKNLLKCLTQQGEKG